MTFVSRLLVSVASASVVVAAAPAASVDAAADVPVAASFAVAAMQVSTMTTFHSSSVW